MDTTDRNANPLNEPEERPRSQRRIDDDLITQSIGDSKRRIEDIAEARRLADEAKEVWE